MPAIERRTRPSIGLGLGIVVLLTASTDDASAAVLGGVATSVGLFAALAGLLLLKAWQAHLLLGGLSTIGGMLALVGGAALLWRSRAGAERRTLGSPGSSAQEFGFASLTSEPVLLPADIDRRELLEEVSRHFVELQAAWDVGAGEALRALTTPDMLEELCAALSVGTGTPNRTEVVALNAGLVAFEELGSTQVVCIEFSGLIRESSALAASPFRELWMLSRQKGETQRWRLARHQTLL